MKNTSFRWVLGLRKHDMNQNYLRNCGTISLTFLLDGRFLLFLFSLKGNCKKLLSKLSYVVYNSDVFNGFLSKYVILCFANVLQIRRVVCGACELCCEGAVTT